jgi:hypothetical protein
VNKKTYNGVRLGFTKGFMLSDDLNYLDKGDRKQVYWKDFTDVKEIEIDLVKAYIYEAVQIDQETANAKKLKKPKLI